MNAQAQTQVKVWTKADVQDLLATNKAAVVRAVKLLYARQTADEQTSSDTKHRNGMGFNSRDARFLSGIAQALPRYNDNMTDKQVAVARRMLPKYWRQLLEVIESNGGAVDYGVASQRKAAIAKARQSGNVVSPNRIETRPAPAEERFGIY